MEGLDCWRTAPLTPSFQHVINTVESGVRLPSLSSMTADGELLVQDLADWGWPAPAGVMIRHAERHVIPSAEEIDHVELTAAGRVAARNLGGRLAHYSELRVLHSPAVRCEQTGTSIAAGAAEGGAHVLGVRRENLLGGSYAIDRKRALARADELGSRFLRLWFSDELEPGLMRPLADSLREHVDLVRTGLETTTSGRLLTVYVTHDWNISVVREGLLGVRNEEAGWPEYLDGVSFALVSGHMQSRFRKSVRSVAP